MNSQYSAWVGKICDVMNPMGVLTSGPFNSAPVVSIHGSMRDALFLAAWKKAIDPSADVSINFSARAALQFSLSEIIRLAVRVVGHSGSGEEDPLIGTLQLLNPAGRAIANEPQNENDEMQLREEVLYFFGILCGFLSGRTTEEKFRSFAYLAAVVGQKDELLSLTVGEHLGPELRSVFEYLCSLHYFQSNIRQSARLSRLVEIEIQLQEMCARIQPPVADKEQIAELVCRQTRAVRGSETQSAVFFLPSAFSDSAAGSQEISKKVSGHLKADAHHFYFVDSFHHRLRWMERLCRARQAVKFENLRTDPLRMQALIESRSGRHRIFILSATSLEFFTSVSRSKLFGELSIPVQEIMHTALELDTLRVNRNWGTAPCFDFLQMVELLAVQGFNVLSGRVMSAMTDGAAVKFLDAMLMRQEIDSDQLYRMLLD
ncbi:MAG: hypothetical protein EBR09_03670 [Proteobacteria bacterium]|nr:hypothetical protein [Pseudomonadota bacterium]